MERHRPKPPKIIFWALPITLFVLYVPLLVMVIGSFLDLTDANQTNSILSLRWYQEVFSDRNLMQSTLNSVIVATSSALTATILGTLSALALDKWIFRGRVVLKSFSVTSLMLPELVLALALLSWFALLGLSLSLTTVIFAHVTLTLPFTTLVVGARLRTLEGSLDDAARDLGATETQILRQVTLPILGPSILTGFLLAFLLSFDDFLVTFYTNGVGSDTLPVKLYSLMKTGMTPKVQALSALMLVVSITFITILLRLRNAFKN